MSDSGMLDQKKRERFSRQISLPEVGDAGQRRLKDSRVLVVGAGGLGSPVAMYLAAAGVGTLGIVDADSVEESNLHRQVLHGEKDLGRRKTDSAADTLASLCPRTRLVTHDTRLDAANADSLIGGYDIVVGCVDNFRARYAIDAACVAQGKANVFGSVSGYEGQASVFATPGPCYRCFFHEPPPEDWRPSAQDKAVLGPIPGVIGCIQATETIKTLLGLEGTLRGRLLLMNGLTMTFREIPLKRDAACPVCGAGEARR